MDQGLSVYVVDDARDAADSLAALLRALGHEAQAFYGGEDVLRGARLAKPDCVLLDIAMAGMDGLELAKRLRAEFGDDIVLVAVTGRPADDPAVQETFDTVDHWFEKPVTLEQIKTLLPPAV